MNQSSDDEQNADEHTVDVDADRASIADELPATVEVSGAVEDESNAVIVDPTGYTS